MNCILRSLLVVKGPDSKSYAKVPYMASVVIKSIQKSFKMIDILKHEKNLDLRSIYFSSQLLWMVATWWRGGLVRDMKKFNETLLEGAFVWCPLLLENSINSFNMLAHSFIRAHVGAKKMQPSKRDIFKIEQGYTKLL